MLVFGEVERESRSEKNLNKSSLQQNSFECLIHNNLSGKFIKFVKNRENYSSDEKS